MCLWMVRLPRKQNHQRIVIVLTKMKPNLNLKTDRNLYLKIVQGVGQVQDLTAVVALNIIPVGGQEDVHRVDLGQEVEVIPDTSIDHIQETNTTIGQDINQSQMIIVNPVVDLGTDQEPDLETITGQGLALEVDQITGHVGHTQAGVEIDLEINPKRDIDLSHATALDLVIDHTPEDHMIGHTLGISQDIDQEVGQGAGQEVDPGMTETEIDLDRMMNILKELEEEGVEEEICEEDLCIQCTQ